VAIKKNSLILDIILYILTLILFCPFTYSKVIYVDDDATGANDGTTWADAYIFLQYALVDANSAEKPVQIYVAQGIYKPVLGGSNTPEDREATFQLINGVTLKGGYAGIGEPDPNTWDIEVYKSVLSGDLAGNDIYVHDVCDLLFEPTREENSYHVVTGSHTDNTSVIMGFTITGGNANHLSYMDLILSHGAGMYNERGNPSIRNCSFIRNSAISSGGGIYNDFSYITASDCNFTENLAVESGGGISNHYSNPRIERCNFVDNVTTEKDLIRHGGAGMYNHSSNPIVTDCNFTQNITPSTGGGMYNYAHSNPKVYHSRFVNNLAGLGGGIHNDYYSAPTVANCCFTENATYSWGEGGGIYNNIYSTATITNCDFVRNYAGESGGAMFNWSNDTLVKNCIFRGNSVGDPNIMTTFEGGGMSNQMSSPIVVDCIFEANVAKGLLAQGGGMSNYWGESPKVTNCMFIGNFAQKGGGVNNHGIGTNSRFIDCSFRANIAENRGGAMYCRDSKPTVINCTFSGNKALSGGGIGGDKYSDTTLANCIFIGNTAHDGGGMYNLTGNIRLSNCELTANTADYGGGVYSSDCNLTTTNCVIKGNLAGNYGGGIYNHGSITALINCTFAENVAGIGSSLACNRYDFWTRGAVDITNCILWDDSQGIWQYDNNASIITISYSNVQGGWTGDGNIEHDPLFVAPGFWDPNTVWIDGDYHLKSQSGRWDTNSQTWIQDDVTSPCIDAGDPNFPVAFEPFPNGAIVNMGAYGGTAEASKSPSGIQSKYGGGTGESDLPYLIYTVEHLNTISAETNDWDKHFKLMADIDLFNYRYIAAVIAADVDPCEPGFQGMSFTGVLDGNGHKISNLTITSGDYVGLFGQTELGAEIKDLRITDVNITGSDYVGGFVGFSKGNISTCYCTGTISGDQRVGGITGRNWSNNITACYSTATITANSDAGGIAANNYGSITNCYNIGAISSYRDAAGLVGENYGTIDKCYSIGAVSGDSRSGGLVSYNWSDGGIVSGFWDTETSGQSTSDGGTGKTTAEMQTASTFFEAGWDFEDETTNGTEDIWWILEGQDYPRLWWQNSDL